MAWRNYGTGSKYHAKKVSIQGEVFDSKKEARRFLELQMLEKAGRISGLQRQKKFVLIPAQYEPESTGPRGGKIKGKAPRTRSGLLCRFCIFRRGRKRLRDRGHQRSEDSGIYHKKKINALAERVPDQGGIKWLDG